MNMEENQIDWDKTILHFRAPDQDEPNREDRPVLSVVAPAYNEELNLREFYRQVSAELDKLNVSWEIILVDDGSADHSSAVFQELNALDPRVKAIQFARNFGNQIAISAGLFASSGDAVIIMDSDLQHPVELIPKMFAAWKEGYSIVHTIRRYNHKTPWTKRLTSKLFYKVMNILSGTHIEPAAPDFKLLDRRVVDILNQMPERTRYLKALIPWLGFKYTYLPFDCKERFAGHSSFTFFKLIELAIDGLISFSTKPLRWITYLGGFVLALTVPYGCWAVFQFCFLGAKTPGWTSIITLNLLLGGATLISLGIIGEYIGRIYNEVKSRPLFTVQKVWGLSDKRVQESSIPEKSKNEFYPEREERQKVA